MKTKHLFSFLFFLAALFILQSCADDQELLPDLEIVDEDNSSHRYAVGPGTVYDQAYICYSGGIAVDKDCDGSYELGWNHSTSSSSACWQQISNKINTAIANGWCYTLDLHPNNCQPSTCYKMTP